MNPILATSLVDLGKDVLLGGIKKFSSQGTIPNQSNSFASELNSVQSTKNLNDLKQL